MVIKQMEMRVVLAFCMICLMIVVPTVAVAQEQNESTVLAFTVLTADDETDNEDEACTHETCTFYAYISTEEYIQFDVRYHRERGYRTIEKICEDCEEAWILEEGQVAMEEITLHYCDSDGVRYYCGYDTSRNNCQHTNVKYIEKINDSGATDNWDGTHTVHNQDVYKIKYCNDCGYEEEAGKTSIEDANAIEKHNFTYDGVCAGCKAICDHANTRIVSNSFLGFKILERDAYSHTMQGVKYANIACAGCGQGIDGFYSEATETKPHEFERGVCWACGYITDCEHLNVNRDVTNDYVIEYKYFDEQNHTARVIVEHYDICEECGEIWHMYDEPEQDIRQNHVIEKGACRCGYSASDEVYGDSVAYLPDSLDVIDAEALLGIAARTVVIPDGATTIGARAFASCPNLEYVVVPDSVRSIATDAFSGSSVTFICSTDSTAADYAQSHNIPLK